MKYFIFCTLLLAGTVSGFAAGIQPEAAALQYYNEKASALAVTQPELRTMKLLALLEKFPSRAGELHSIITAALERSKITPQIKALSLEIMKKNPDNILIVILLSEAYEDIAARIKAWQDVLLCAPVENLSDQQERAVLISGTIIFEYYSGQRQCSQQREFFLKFFDRFNNAKADPRFRVLFLSNALNFYRQCIWEIDCIAPNGKFWEKLPAEGNKMIYLEILDELKNLEKHLEFPVSIELLQLYTSHNHPQALIYGKKFLPTNSDKVMGTLFAAAQTFKNRELFDHCVKFFAAQKKNSENPELMQLIALHCASEFNSFDMLKKFASAPEVEFFQTLYAKKYADAKTQADQLLTSGKITFPATIRAIVDLVWQTKDQTMLKAVITAMETDPKLLNPSNANSVAYTAAVLNIELDKAEKLARSAMEQLPNNFAVMDTLAYILYRKQQFPEAYKLITDAEKLLSPGDACAVLYLHAAEIELAHTKNRSAAKKWLNRGTLASRDNDDEYDYRREAQLQEMLK